MSTLFSTTIIGGGIMGLSIAYRLTKALRFEIKPQLPYTITLIDDGLPSASTQAAGILATHGAQHFLSPLRRQIVESTRSYPKFLREMEDILGPGIAEQVGYQPLSHYHLYDESPLQEEVKQRRLRRLQREYSDQGKESLPQFLLPHLQGSGYFPKFPKEKITGLEFHSHTLEPEKLLATLRQAGEKLQVKYLQGRVTQIQDQGDQFSLEYQNLNGQSSFCISDKVVITTGSGTQEILSQIKKNYDYLKFFQQNRLKNLSGAILITEPFLNYKGNLLLNFYNKRYLLHKPDKVLFGSYDFRRSEDPPPPLKYILKEDLIRLFPKCPVQEKGMQTGKRLYHPDKLPLLGYLDRNLFIATALYKSGIALAPLYSRLATQMLLGSLADSWGKKISEIELHRETDYLSPLRKKD